ncbi:peptidase U62 modulator of DNA gyrase [Gemmatirosa kalamazoonensis]|uniref:Peptidase U62 modulator of DNA gyrase n=1 Tax=Gemmatirosa kalamazoonensis TaxID=861299 RepID=W0REZ8_9BACT|nr:TldD/PmbA family protein [Gemmatirosa kalamazoonensis]AHG88905.1 peptidase U62 modulator of DNA gyrase [Gemmatirosa kalamazoonensis]
MSGPKSLLTAAAAPRVLSRDECEAIAKKLLSFATADETSVSVGSGTRGNTRFAVNQISTSGDAFDANVSVRSSFGRRSAAAVTNAFDDASLKAVVERAEALARLAPEDPEYVPLLGPQEYRDTPGWVDSTAGLDPAARAAAVRAVTEPARAAGLTATGFLETNAGATALANSKGLFAYARQTRVAMTTTVRTADGTGSGWAGGQANDFTRLDPAALGRTAIDKARRSVNPVAIEPGRYTVVLEPTAVGNLVQLIAGALSARAADEGRSFMSKPGGGNKIGQKVVDERVTIVSDPYDPAAPGTPFAGDGLPTQAITWIENGVVKNLAYDRYWAQKTGHAPTGGGFGAGLRMSGGDASLEDLIASTERGLLVTRFWYIRPVDPRTILYTGLTRDGTFLIENGKITKAVKNLRYNESPIFLLNNLEAMGRPVRVSASEDGSPGPAIVVPPVKARDFNFTSLSDAV